MYVSTKQFPIFSQHTGSLQATSATGIISLQIHQNSHQQSLKPLCLSVHNQQFQATSEAHVEAVHENRSRPFPRRHRFRQPDLVRQISMQCSPLAKSNKVEIQEGDGRCVASQL